MTRKSGGKPDSNQAEIVDALRAAGATVHITSGVGGGFPDLVVGMNYQSNYLMEVKTEKGDLNGKQLGFHGLWQGQVCVVRSVEDALRAIGRI